MSYILGIDLGGTKISAGLVNSSGQVSKLTEVPTQASQGRQAVLLNLSNLIQKLTTPGIKKIGIAVAGQIDFKRGLIHNTPNIAGLKNLPLVSLLKRRFKGKDFKIENDVHCFVLAEGKFGAGKEHKNFIGLTLGTGIGGGLVIDGKLYRGAHNSAGEFGHLTIASPAMTRKIIKCSCGHLGHFEALASGRAIEKIYWQLTGKKLAARQIEDRLMEKDLTAEKVYQQVSEQLAVGLANLINSLDPEIIIVGGGLVKRDQLLLKQALQKMKKLLLYKSLEKTKVTTARLGQKAGLIGATLLFR